MFFIFLKKQKKKVSSIKFNTSLRELYLSENKISSTDCVQIGNLLRGNSFLNVLDLRNNLIQDNGLDCVCEGLSHQPTQNGPIKIFDLFNTNNQSTATDDSTISQNSGVLILNLSNNQLTSRAMNRLMQTLVGWLSIRFTVRIISDTLFFSFSFFRFSKKFSPNVDR